MKILYIDCFSGVSGDMFLGALLNCGLPRTLLKRELSGLPLDPYTLSITSAQRMNISGYRLQVKPRTKKHHHRGLREIKRIITGSQLTKQVKELSLAAFERLARVEAKIHNQKIADVHFHEVGALDSIIDIVGAAIGMDYFKFDKVCSSPLPLGSGFTTAQHGVIPLPAPATLALLKGIPVYGTSLHTEMVTPTGAALVTSLTNSFGPMPPMRVSKIGYGAGSRQLQDRPNLLRMVIGEDSESEATDQILILEAQIDDMNPEIYDYLMERLFEGGALDVSYSSIQMKKNRPGVLIRVICPPEKKSALATIMFQESTTAGIRSYPADRVKLVRKKKTIPSPYGRLSVKVFLSPDGGYFAAPEYDQCKKIAKKQGFPLKKVYLEITKLLPPLNTKFKL
jgi:uncharacterized protein (TIGR00299 family) protein